jgi:hypothetical protein
MKLTAPYLKAQKWVDVARGQIDSQGLDSFYQDATDYAAIPVATLDWSDLVDEVYGGNDPLNVEDKSLDLDGNVQYKMKKIDEDSFNFSEDLRDVFLPALRMVARKADNLAGVGEFEVEINDEDEIEITFIVQEDELQDGKVPFKQSLLAKIITAGEKAFSEFEGPLFERATVDVGMTETPDGNMIPDPTTAKLKLPDITVKDSQAVKPDFTLTVKRSFLDKYATTRSYAFTFEVKNTKFQPLPNGLVRPAFEATLKEYKNA